MAWNPTEDQGYQQVLAARRAGNPMARFSVYNSNYKNNPFVLLGNLRRRNARELLRNSDPRAALGNVGRQVASSLRLMAQPPATRQMSRPPETEAEVRDRDQLRRMYDERAASVRPLIDDQLQAAFDERTKRVGKFMKNAYSAYGDTEGAVSPLEAAIVRGQYGTVNPILQRFREEERKRVARRFQDTHAWARKRENLDMLDVAVNYLMSRDQMPEYYR